jgi:hypothetical protein
LYRWSCLVEAVAFAGFVGAFIWKFQVSAPWTWWLILVWLVASFVARRDTPKTMGWRADNLWSATKRSAWFFGVSSLLLFFAGLLLGMLHRTPTHLIEPRRFGGYLAFCLLQQVGLNSFLTNRLLAAFEKPVPAAVVAGVLFGALHWPNPVLVPLTFVGGVAMAWLFATERNILPLTVGQALLGALVWWAFPLAWHHSMRVGPGYGEYKIK